MTDLAFASAAELAAMIRNREISPVEVARTTVARIEQTQPMQCLRECVQLNAFITVAAEPAMRLPKRDGAVSRNWPAGCAQPGATTSKT
jgi:Asp-tRNA(Asn)/Glu-tRNA(Gln) amidotransferase A subunit family amidase